MLVVYDKKSETRLGFFLTITVTYGGAIRIWFTTDHIGHVLWRHIDEVLVRKGEEKNATK